MEHIKLDMLLQYGALGVVFLQTVLFFVLGRIILSGLNENRKAYEELSAQSLDSFNKVLDKTVSVIVNNTEATTKLADSQKELQSAFLRSVNILEEDHRRMQNSFYELVYVIRDEREHFRGRKEQVG